MLFFFPLNLVAQSEMSECCITFPGHVSRATLCHLVIDYMKYILYYRGQFPLPLDQLKHFFDRNSESASIASKTLQINDQQIYCDISDHSGIFSRSNAAVSRTKQNFINTISKFDTFFNELSKLLESENIVEIVLSLGPNMLNPKELYRILLPAQCSRPECTVDYASAQRCKLQFFREIMHSNLWTDLKVDSLLPISVLLLLGSGVALNEHMELKNFYSFPRHCKQRIVRFTDKCIHVENASIKLESFQDLSICCTATSSHVNTSGLWVKLKPDLKGFKSFSESNRSLPCSSLM